MSVDDEEFVKARDFALAEIVKLSDSYRDMKINKVISAETARSVWCGKISISDFDMLHVKGLC